MISTFSPDCTFPDHQVNYVGAPPLRSTLDIVWPCILTLIASIYSALHLDVMADTAATSATPCGCKWCKRLWNGICRSVKSLSVGLAVAAIALFAPELIVQRALVEWDDCSKFLDAIKSCGHIDPEIQRQWTRTHGHYVNMGGFRLRCRGPLSRHKSAPCDCEEMTLDNDCLIYAIACGFLPQKPPVTSQEISDLSKASAFTKVIAIWQIGYFLADLVTRLARRLPVTQLEIGVAAFAMLAIVTLCAYFDKPKGVNIGTRVCFQSHLDPEAREQKGDRGRVDKTREPSGDQEKQHAIIRLGRALDKRGKSFGPRSHSFLRELTSQLSLERDENDIFDGFWLSAGFAGISALPFGAVHVAAWNANFPSVADLWLWRICSLVSMVILLLMTALVIFFDFLDTRFGHLYLDVWGFIMIYPPLALYTLARVILIVEMVRCMLYLPPQAFVTTWTANVPHLG